ncbi:MAG: hypothetical protein JWO86_9188 [Myxococcaceae bacterium]|jgi:hypothetical protein|nr:hypothetical protein [Myxococcaceae bacterium]MEA2748978.1 hypothetical protein [Myxococcales bacterium]
MKTTSIRRTCIVGGLIAAVLAVLGACSDAATASPCSDIPAGGCPLSYGVACQDPTCEAVYSCQANKVWQLDHTCPPHEAGVPAEASSEAGDGASDAPSEGSRSFDASIDAPPGASGGPGCENLQAPDCSLGFALACPMGCCGCEDLFVCQGGGWNYYATCNE